MNRKAAERRNALPELFRIVKDWQHKIFRNACYDGSIGRGNLFPPKRLNHHITLAYGAGGTRVGTVDILTEEHPDGSKSDWYAFHESDGSLWACFAVPREKPFDDIYSGQDGKIHFVRTKAEPENK